ncbi:Uncharacterised protein [Klebsiella pneumoniae]|nr:Uncharacterised protein [Klebsiella pneumoniae]
MNRIINIVICYLILLMKGGVFLSLWGESLKAPKNYLKSYL